MAGPDGEAGEPELAAERGLFRAEYERELGTWLRRRLGYLCIAFAIFQIVSVTLLILGSASSENEREAAPLSPRIAHRAEEADRRAEEGLPMRPGDARALAARDAEERRRERERSAQAVVSTIDAFGAIARNLASGVADQRGENPFRIGRPSRVQERVIDRWWLEGDVAAPAGRNEPQDAPVSTRRAVDRRQSTGAAGSDDARSSDDGVEELSSMGGQASEESEASDGAAQPTRAVALADGTDRDVLILPWWAWLLVSLPTFAVLGWFGLRVRPRLYTRGELVQAATRMILSLGLLNFGFECGLLLANPDAPIRPLVSIFYWHLTASLFLPWSWRESLKPIVPLLACWLLLRLGLATSDGSWSGFLWTIAALPFLFGPALVLCYARLRWHQSRFKSGFVGRRFLEMRREFIQARAVHESLFPKAQDLGWLQFNFAYRPAADIGGDFIHAWVDEYDRFHVALIDVTGHGLASAMTVARIHGEIERLRDEHPEKGPGWMLARLNRYFQRLLARHRLFATAVLITLDPRTGEMRFASAGHPPVFIRSRGGVRELDSTTFLLGAVDGATFGEEELSVRLEEGDRLILFTDGAYDAKNPRGERFGLDRLREIVRRPSAPPSWTRFLMNLVETFEAGTPEDDLLVAELAFLQRRSISSVTGDEAPIPRSSMSGASA